MSSLKAWLLQRRSQFYQGESLRQSVDSFLEMIDQGAEVHEFKDAIIVLEPFGLPGNMRGWLLFDRFTKGTASAMRKVSEGFTGNALYAATHDERIRNLLIVFGYQEYNRDSNDYYLVKRTDHGM